MSKNLFILFIIFYQILNTQQAPKQGIEAFEELNGDILIKEAKKDIEALKSEFSHLEFVLEIFDDKNKFFCPSYVDGLHMENSEWKENCWRWFNLWVPIKNWIQFLNVVNNPYAGPSKLNLAVRPILENVDERTTPHEELQNKIKKLFPSSSTIENKNFETKSTNLINIVRTFEEIKLYRETKKSPPNWLNRKVCEVVDTWMLFYRKYEAMRRYKIYVEENKDEEIKKLKMATEHIDHLWATEQKALSGESTEFEHNQSWEKSPFEHKLPEHYFWPRTDLNNNFLKNKENSIDKKKVKNSHDLLPEGYMYMI
uniref:Uncharacterized protein n=1 Tax=Meloidogyne hapla TaxID=6305 RepID=A0A1I8BHU6_MELHA